MTTELRINLPREPQDRDLIDMAARGLRPRPTGRARGPPGSLRRRLRRGGAGRRPARRPHRALRHPGRPRPGRLLEGVEEGALRSLEAEAAARVVQVRRKAAR